MKIHYASDFSLFLGAQNDSIDPEVLKKETSVSILNNRPFLNLQKNLGITHLVFQKQIHAITGTSAYKKDSLCSAPLLSREGDFLITNEPGLGIGVLTADCLPLIFFDKKTKAIGIAHAGWRGTVNKIALSVLESLQKTYGSNVNDIQVFFGPSAQVCCYQVDEAFKTALANNPLAQKTLQNRSQKYYFDMTAYNKQILLEAGILPDSLEFEFHYCTICTPSYCSYRRSGGDKQRQMTVISLK